MQVSVIIPVYNAEPYITRAVESALAQPETGEVILVEDASPDNSLAVCQALATQYEKVKLFQHANGANLGAGESRNLAIQRATCDVLSFLDADDYYLPGHLAQAIHILDNQPEVDGVYSTVQCEYETVSDRERTTKALHTPLDIIRPRQDVTAEALFQELAYERINFHLISLVIRRRLINKLNPPFNPAMRLAQDRHFIFRLAVKGRLVAGQTASPTAIYHRHANNRSNIPRTGNEEFTVRMTLSHNLLAWAIEHLSGGNLQAAMRFYVRARIRLSKTRGYVPEANSGLRKRLRLALVIIERPDLWTKSVFWEALLYYLLPGTLRPQATQHHDTLTDSA